MAIRDVMHRDHRPRSGVALGGIGTGSVELRKDGIFRNVWLFNNEPYGTGPALTWPEDSMLFFLVRYRVAGQTPRLKLLQIGDGIHAGAIECPHYIFPWLTCVDRIDYEAAYPHARLTFADADMPLNVELDAWSPFIPHDVDASSIPAVFFNIRVRSRTSRRVDVMLLASMRNACGYDRAEKLYTTDILDAGAGCGVQMSCEGMDTAASSWGTQVLASLGRGSTYYAGWEHLHPYYQVVLDSDRLPDVDDTDGRNILDKATGKRRAMARLFSTVAASKRLTRRGAGMETTFLMTWHFPNLYASGAAEQRSGGRAAAKPRLEGHDYANRFADAAGVMRHAAANRRDLRARTDGFLADYFDSTLPTSVLEQVHSHLNTFATSSWLTRDRNFGIQEGMLPDAKRGPLATIDVGMYGSVATAALFPELDKQMIRAHQRLRNAETGSICHGIDRDFTTHDVREAVTERLDLPSQYVLMALRGYFWTGDEDYLREVWPSVTAALEYVLRDRDANGDLLPDMEGVMCTYDNFPMYGAAAFIGSLWLAALAYAAEAAKAVGDGAAAERYADIRRKATPVFEAKLWNGDYYRLWNDEGGEVGGVDEGCLTDQLMGQWAMHFVGLGDVVRPSRVRKALRSILRMSFKPWGLVNCRWPGETFLHPVEDSCWVDQANTCWTGVELEFASLLIYEGLVREGLAVVENVDARYRKAGLYWDHQEFGGHYYRPMSSWAILQALAGQSIAAGRFTFDPRLDEPDQKLLFTFDGGWGHYVRKAGKDRETVELAVRSGRLRCGELALGLAGAAAGRVRVRARGKAMKRARYDTAECDGRLLVRFRRPVSVAAGRSLRVTVSR